MESITNGTKIDCQKTTITQINQLIRKAAKEKVNQFILDNPLARHNLGVGITDPITLIFNGDVGYYAVSLCDNVKATIYGNTGWAVAENLMNGEVIVEGNAAAACAASLRGGIVVVKGNAGARAGIGLKGGMVIIGGSTGYMTGFMMQKGTMVICGNAGKALGDSMYDGVIYVGGDIAELGNGTKVTETPLEEYQSIKQYLKSYGINPPSSFKKVISSGTLHHFSEKEFSVWKEVL